MPLLLEKSLERGWKVVVEAGDAVNIASLDKALWTFSDESFLPHTIYDPDSQTALSYLEHPILLCAGDENPNSADVRFFVSGAVPGGEGDYQRLVFMFDGHNPDSVTRARTAWKTLSKDHQTTYWQQDAQGRWMKKA